MKLSAGAIFPNTFSLKNDGYLTVYPKRIIFRIRNATDSNGNTLRDCGAGTTLLGSSSLKRGESADFAVKPGFGIANTSSIVRADILLIVAFQQWGWYWPITKRVKIAIWQDESGNAKFAKPPLTDEDRVERWEKKPKRQNR
ncbi:MAG TPA: hypothetical protein VH170_09590 [Chthoniobacterales bacterium]|nr:hypothetical protein [Chthoniobacterales bacterium]